MRVEFLKGIALTFLVVFFGMGCGGDGGSSEAGGESSDVEDATPGDVEDDAETGADGDAVDVAEDVGLDVPDVPPDVPDPVDVGNPFAGTIIFTEIMRNPSVVADAEGEWFEIHNVAADPIDLEGWIIRDNNNDEHVVAIPLLMKPGESFVFGNNEDVESNGGVTVDYAYPPGELLLGNGEDSLVLVAPTGVVDTVVFGTAGEGWPTSEGVSLNLDVAAYDVDLNDLPESWCDAPLWNGAIEPSSPGNVNPSCDAEPESLCGDGEDNDGDGTIDCDDPDCLSSVDCSPVKPGDLVFTEIMQNPKATSDAEGEWFELANVSEIPIDLNGLTIADVDGQEHLISSPEPLVVPPGQFVVLAANPFAQGLDVFHAYEGITLGNGEDSLILRLGDLLIDQVVWDDGATFPDPNGASMSLDPESLDATLNDQGFRWCPGALAYETGDLGTPGAPNPACPDTAACGDGDLDEGEVCDDGNDIAGDGCESDCTVTPGACGDGAIDEGETCDDGNTLAGDGCSSACEPENPVDPGTIVITEVAYNPSGVADSDGEWFEVFNASAAAVSIQGWHLMDDGTDHHVIAGESPVVVPAGGLLVLGKNGDLETNGGIPVDYVFGSDISMANGGDELVLSWAGVEVDRVAWEVPPWPSVNGESMQLDVDAIDAVSNDDPTHWCPSTVALLESATPGLVNGSCSGPPAVCGDGVIEGEEECDDGNPEPADGCEPDCTVTPPECGNFLLEFGEECDDGNVDDGDGCTSECLFPPPECGNAILEEGELCDDGNIDSGDGCEADCVPTPASTGDVIITEIMWNPSVVSDSAGEWFEIQSVASVTLDLNGWSIADLDSDFHVINTEGPFLLHPGEIRVFGRNADAETNGGVSVDLEYEGVVLGNSGDALALLAPGGLMVDAVVWGDGSGWPDPVGASSQLDPDFSDAASNDNGANWCVSVLALEGGDFGTPGAINPECGVPASCGDDACDPDAGEACGNCPSDCGTCDPCLPAETEGCGECACEACVCDLQPACCSGAWNEECIALCAGACGETSCGSSGCDPAPVPGCSGCDCETCVCDANPACCDLAWDESCAAACGTCGQDCGSATGCESSGLPGCDGCACEECTCSLQPECCDVAWDATCVSVCDLCSGACISDGCTTSELPTCNACECQNCVCTENPACCDVAWDESCTAACQDCGQDCGAQDGCQTSAFPGCDGCACESCVCDQDASCCEVSWDQECVSLCDGCSGCVADGCLPTTGAGCDGCECEACVCAEDPTCCDVAWDASCVFACQDCGQECVSNGCTNSASPGCEGCGCEDCVCGANPACCDVAWDETCALLCDACGNGSCAFECGNAVLEPGEACDDGIANSDTAADACRTSCTLPFCGDGVVDEGEFCDDTNQAEGDGCSSACLVETVALTSNNLVITEIMYNPSAVFDAHGEWFEVLNTGAGTLDLAGLVVTNGAGESHTLAPAGQLLLAAGGQAVLGRSADLASNGGLVLDYVYATSEDLSLQLENAGDTLSLTFEGTLVDAVSYDNGVEFPLANGAALVLSNQAQDTLSNDAGTNWCVATSPYGAGDWGTPGGVNDLCPGCGNGACEETESCQSCPADCSACPDGCSPLSFGGCAGCACEACVCGIDSFCCDVVWDGDCVTKCDVDCGGCESSEESGSESGSEG